MMSSSKTVLRALPVVLPLVLAHACTHVRESEPGRTATEQLLFSTAAERVCDALTLQIPDDSKVFVDNSFVEGTDSKYLVATLRNRILREGGRLVAQRPDADLVIEPRVGALSVDRKDTIVGIRSFPIPIPLSGDIQFPQIALYKSDRQQGVVKLALASYDAKTGALRQSVDPVYGFSRRTDWVALVFIGWQTNDLMPEPENDRWIGEGTFD